MARVSVRTPEGTEFAGRDPWWYLVHDGPQLVRETRAMAEQARHHNGFNVGALLLAASNEGDITTFPGANQNLEKGENNTKMCAERIAFARMINAEKLANKGRKGYEAQLAYQAIAMLVSGPPQPDTHSGLVTRTLHSCGLDREVMWNEPSVRPDTLMISIHPEEDVFEIYEHEVLQTMHALPDEIPPLAYDDEGFQIWGASTPAYERGIANYQAMGKEPPYARIAHWAITGFIKPHAPAAA